MSLIQSKGRLLDLSRPVVMGILNATPDSFYQIRQHGELNTLVENAGIMLNDGATILDIGGASTKPGSEIIDTKEELKRVIPLIEAIHRQFPDAWISIDTYNAIVAREAIGAGASIVNDVSSGSIDGDMLKTVAALKVPYIAMHMQGTPKTMQLAPQYTDVVTDVRRYLYDICNQCNEAGIVDVILDPGFGFGKTVEHNFSLLRSLRTLSIAGRPILAGLSRKSMICKPLKVKPENALNGTTALNMVALEQGANILRVHDVKQAVEVVKLFELLHKG